MNSLYTPQKVHRPLALLLPAGSPHTGDLTRFSLVGDRAGIAGQRAAHHSIYGNDPAIQTIASWPDEAWDPDHPDVGAQYGVRWIRMEDLHHTATGAEPVAAVALVNGHLVVSITLSSTTRHIIREDGEDENGYTRLILAIINHYPTLTRLRWADDVTRAGRDAADWALLKNKCKMRDVRMVLGGQEYDLKLPADEIALGALGLVGTNDDPMRRRKLTGKRLLKYRAGGAAIAESQMPHGWCHQRDQYGRAVREGDRGLVPHAQGDRAEALGTLYEMTASGAPWHRIGTKLVELEAQGKIERRSHVDPGSRYADTVTNPQATYDAAKSIFVRSNFTPPVPPDASLIERYEAGEDPAELFDPDTRLFLAKVELMRTGRYYRRLRNDIRGRGVVLDGVPAVYADEHDEYGWFDVLAQPWPWPAHPETGIPVERFGIPDAICRRVGARLLRELRSPAATTGGRAHATDERRILQNFANWTRVPGHPAARYADEPTEFGVEARQNNSGRENFIVLFRRKSVSDCKGRTGWHWLGVDERRPDHIAATGNLAELAASVAHALDNAVEALLEVHAIAAVDVVLPSDTGADRRPAVRARAARSRQSALDARDDAKALRLQSGRRAAAGDFAGADRYDDLAADKDREAAVAEARAEQLDQELAGLDQAALFGAPSTVEAEVSVAAYLVAGLERAAHTNGRGPRPLGLLADRTLRGWAFRPCGDELHWEATAALPLRDGGEALVPLHGVIRNVRSRPGKALAAPRMVARYVFQEGRDLDAVASVLEVGRKRLLTARVMPWLVAHGVTARGAKNALVDHPIHAVRRVVHAAVTTGTPAVTESLPWPRPWVDLVTAIYLDPHLDWGDAACPDDVRGIHQLAATLDTPQGHRRGLTVTEAALAVGMSEDAIRELVKPRRRSAGFTRPQYLRYLPGSHKTRVQLIPCPHGCRRGWASRVALLPEVAASGYGVLCPTCRRAPSTADAIWAATAFLPAYLEPVTGRGGAPGSLRTESQTTPCAAQMALDIVA